MILAIIGLVVVGMIALYLLAVGLGVIWASLLFECGKESVLGLIPLAIGLWLMYYVFSHFTLNISIG